ncbi:hypothetical protein GCM10009825_04300 [Arthrobacter humicola]|uniref:Uncharacterized protein n=1 Tax=Arthrobacter humicola TaxID=409291 RepID=A0ABN2YFV4_9MICC
MFTRLKGVVDRVRGVVGVRDEQSVQEAFDPRRMLMGMAVPMVMIIVAVVPVAVVVAVVGMVVVMAVVPMVMIIVAVVLGPVIMAASVRLCVDGRGCPGTVEVMGFGHDRSALSGWWWRGVPPSECSAWKMASVTSWRACSFSRR